jgi:hypothetical protein
MEIPLRTAFITLLLVPFVLAPAFAQGGGGSIQEAPGGSASSSGSKNPLIGVWRIDRVRSSETAARVLQGEEVEFLPRSVVSSGAVTDVNYELLQGRVIVDYVARGRKQMIILVDEDTIRMDLPMDEFLVYQKCTDRNRLLGRWTVDTQASHTAAIVPFEQIEVLEFRPGEMGIRLRGGNVPPAIPVIYQVECDVVSVTNPMMNETQRYRILGPDRAEGIMEDQPTWTLFFQRVP